MEIKDPVRYKDKIGIFALNSKHNTVWLVQFSIYQIIQGHCNNLTELNLLFYTVEIIKCTSLMPTFLLSVSLYSFLTLDSTCFGIDCILLTLIKWIFNEIASCFIANCIKKLGLIQPFGVASADALKQCMWGMWLFELLIFYFFLFFTFKNSNIYSLIQIKFREYQRISFVALLI